MYKIDPKELAELEYEFLSILGVGRENAKKAREMPFTPRTIRLITSSLRRKGLGICTSDKGYWIAKSLEELDETISRLESNYIGTGQTIQALKETRDAYKESSVMRVDKTI